MLFGDRSPPGGFVKQHLLSRSNNSLNWLFFLKDEERDQDKCYIIQQVPRSLPDFKAKLDLIKKSMSVQFQTLLCKQGMRNIIFDIQEIVEKPDLLDVWVIYQPNILEKITEAYSLEQLLWNKEFDQSQTVNNYKLNHGKFYEIFSAKDDYGSETYGKANISMLIFYICQLLKATNNMSTMYGNLRLENIIVMLDRSKRLILKIGFIGFEYLTRCDDPKCLRVPDRIDHLPPDVTSFMLKYQCHSQQCTKSNENHQDAISNCKMNIKDLSILAQADVFSLGSVLLQIATGVPSQCELPVMIRCKKADNTMHQAIAHFGYCTKGLSFERYAK